jgi:hypothetical protein
MHTCTSEVDGRSAGTWFHILSISVHIAPAVDGERFCDLGLWGRAPSSAARTASNSRSCSANGNESVTRWKNVIARLYTSLDGVVRKARCPYESSGARNRKRPPSRIIVNVRVTSWRIRLKPKSQRIASPLVLTRTFPYAGTCHHEWFGLKRAYTDRV